MWADSNTVFRHVEESHLPQAKEDENAEEDFHGIVTARIAAVCAPGFPVSVNRPIAKLRLTWVAPLR